MDDLQEAGGFVTYCRLRGHRGQVLCAATPDAKWAGEALVATSAEDSTVRLWDLRDGGIAADTGLSSSSSSSSGPSPSRSSPRVTMCLCRCFGGEPVSSVVFGKGGANTLYCSAGGKVVEFDLRSTGGGSRALLLTSPTAVLADSEEEVNELTVHSKGGFLASADDSGMVKVYNTRTRRVEKTLKNAHTNICNAVRFRPRASWDIASGALDSTLIFWDFSTGRVRRKINLAEAAGGTCSASTASSCSPGQLFNPPFVHSVDFTADGSYLAAGLGDSSVVIFDTKTRTPVGRCDGHSAPICQVHYPCFHPDFLISAGNDQRLLVWNQRAFGRQQNLPSHPTSGGSAGNGEGGGGGSGCLDDCGNDGAVKKTKESQKPGKKKGGRAKKVNKNRLPAFPKASGSSGSDAGLTNAEKAMAASPEVGRRVEKEVGGETRGNVTDEHGEANATRSHDDDIFRWTVPSQSMLLEEKPNWVTSFASPYPGIVVADTSSEAKILRWRGGL